MTGRRAEIEAQIEEAAEAIRNRSPVEPRLAFVLGSGMGPVAEELEDSALERSVRVDFRDIPHFPVPTGEGHDGRLVLGHVAGIPTAILQGRVHLYEGYSPQQVVFPIRTLERLGVRTLVLTNAAGGVGRSLEVGDLVLIEDHLSFAGLSGLDPTRGSPSSASGPRFTSLNGAYDRALRELARQVARECDVPVSSGVYAHVVGPAFETPAEIRFLRGIGADVVGMSTVPEVVAARQAGIRVLAISCVTNLAIDRIDTEMATSAEEVFESLKRILPGLGQVLAGVARGLAAQGADGTGST